ncbi:PREDICTED: peroxisomal membrane protein 11B, partial [Chaetura pelagica]|uniref:peroxisomal membrane protein 11B n=1 Tax=Chaetura pelagica TaxID=8897 RepID=UPI00052386CE
YYLFALVVNLSRDLYELRVLLELEASGKRGKNPGNGYYLFALVVNLSRDLYELRVLLELEASGKRGKNPGNGLQLQAGNKLQQLRLKLQLQLQLLLRVLGNNPPLLLDLVKNTCDLFIPLDKLGLFQTSRGFVGLCGLSSSLLSILTILHPWLKPPHLSGGSLIPESAKRERFRAGEVVPW